MIKTGSKYVAFEDAHSDTHVPPINTTGLHRATVATSSLMVEQMFAIP